MVKIVFQTFEPIHEMISISIKNSVNSIDQVLVALDEAMPYF